MPESLNPQALRAVASHHHFGHDALRQIDAQADARFVGIVHQQRGRERGRGGLVVAAVLNAL